MRPKKSSVMRLPAEQQALLTTLLPELQKMAESVHWKFFRGCDDLATREDLLQTTLSQLYTAPRFPPPDSEQLMRWANVAMRNVALHMLDKSKRDKLGSYIYTQEQEYHAIVPATGEEKVAYLFRVAQLHLRPVVNQVLLGYGLGHSGKQIAAKLGIPHATVRQHFYTAKNTLKSLMVTA